MDLELIVLGTASQVPTRDRNHNGYLLRWGAEGFLFDPGEGTQRQLTHAGVAPSAITRICITHLHGDHCLGLPGVVQRLTLDQLDRPVDLYYPAAGEAHIDALLSGSVHAPGAEVRRHPLLGDETLDLGGLALTARPLRHRTDTLGYRVEEPDGRRMVPERLLQRGISGPDVGRLQRDGSLEVAGATVTLDEVSAPRQGRRFAFVMDTGVCDAAVALARDVDLLVAEATFLEPEAELAERYLHLTAAQAAGIATRAGARRLVLTHFSQRYPDLDEHAEEAGAIHDDVVVARDLDRIGFPPRR